MSRRDSAFIVVDLFRPLAGSGRREVVADLLTVRDGDLLVWQRGRVVFRCPVSVIDSIAFAPHPAADRQDLASANTRWSAFDDENLRALYAAGDSVGAIALRLGRREGGIRTRIARLGLRRATERPGEGQDSAPGAGQDSVSG
jgi:hypothetical protein